MHVASDAPDAYRRRFDHGDGASGHRAVPVALSVLTFPDGCVPFPRGYGDSPVYAGRPARIELEPGACATEALAGVPALAVQWTPLGLDQPVVRGVLRAGVAATGTPHHSADV